MKKKILIRLAKIAAIVVGVVLVLGLTAFFILNSSSFQSKMRVKATETLKEELKTNVKIDHIYFDLLGGDVELYGVEIEDQQQRKMFQMDKLEVAVSLRKLLVNEIGIKKANISGLRARLFKEPDQPANYQFVIDAFKKDSTKTKTEDEAKKKEKMSLRISKAKLRDLDVSYNDNSVKIEEVVYKDSWMGRPHATISNLALQWVSQSKKGPKDNYASISKAKVKEEGGGYVIDLDELKFKVDNRLPRKNTGKPKRGFFDAGHLDITADMRLALNSVSKDTISASLLQCTARDTMTGFDIKDLRCDVLVNKGVAHITNLTLQQKDTKLKIETAEMVLPNKKDSIPLSFSTGNITGTAYLKDIARPFAPVLKQFSIPLNLSLTMDGNDEALHFHNVKVKTSDNKLSIAANGDITNLKEKQKLAVVFKVANMTTSSDKATDIINQFAVKKLMMGELKKLGAIVYTGQFGVYWKREVFSGTLTTKIGNMNFEITLDDLNKYLKGSLSSKNLEIGKAFDVPEVGTVACRTNFNIDFSKERTAKIRKNNKGNLPIGTFHVNIDEANYMKIRMTNISAVIESNGYEANGNIKKTGSLMDLNCSFVYTSTTEGQNLKVKPSISPFKKKTEEEKAAQREAKEKKKQEKALKKEQTKQEKALKKEQAKQEKANKKKVE